MPYSIFKIKINYMKKWNIIYYCIFFNLTSQSKNNISKDILSLMENVSKMKNVIPKFSMQFSNIITSYNSYKFCGKQKKITIMKAKFSNFLQITHSINFISRIWQTLTWEKAVLPTVPLGTQAPKCHIRDFATLFIN